jgi:catechol 2,3-dioxygenase-like lactoylglutathione lyase family enzyme
MTWQTVPQPGEDTPQIGFFKLTVRDLDAAREFYCAAFGMIAGDPIVQRDLTEIVLKSPGNPFALTLLAYADGRALPIGSAYGPVGFYVVGMEQAIARAEAAGARLLRGPLSFGTVSYAFLESPERHVIELIKR